MGGRTATEEGQEEEDEANGKLVAHAARHTFRGGLFGGRLEWIFSF